jgi:hypothetical protein
MAEKHKQYIQDKLSKNMIMFGRVVMSNMFSAASPNFHYKIAESLIDDSQKQVNIIAPHDRDWET